MEKGRQQVERGAAFQLLFPEMQSTNAGTITSNLLRRWRVWGEGEKKRKEKKPELTAKAQRKENAGAPSTSSFLTHLASTKRGRRKKEKREKFARSEGLGSEKKRRK